MFKLCWIKKSDWSGDGGYTCYTEHNNVEEIIKIMSRHIYNGEWIEDNKGNKLDINLREVCAS